MSRFTSGFVQNYLNNLDPAVGSGGSPSGPAGGDLIGNFPNPFLIPSGVTAGTYGTSVTVPQFTVDSKGRIISASDVSITFPPPSTVIMDDGPVVIGARYPTQPSVEGCWYGYNTKQYTVADSVVLGNNCRGAFSGAVAIGYQTIVNNVDSIGVGTSCAVSGGSSSCFGLNTNDGGVSVSTCLGAGAQTVSPNYALSFGLNSQSVFSNALNLRLNNSDRQIEAFTKLYQTFVTANGVDVQLSYTGANSSKTSFFTGIWNTDVLLPLATTGYIGYEIVIVNKSSADLNIYADPGKTSFVGSLATQQWGFITVVDTVADVAASWSFQVGSGPIVMDNIASSSQFPTAPQNQGCWYGTGSKIACGANGVCIGNGVGGAGNISPESITIGYQANANSPGGTAPSIAIGVRATCGTGNNPVESNIAIGYEAACFGYPTTGSSSIAFGRSAAGLFGGMAFGNNSVAIFDSVAMGIGARCEGNANGSVAFGTAAIVNNINNGVALGAGAQVTSPFYALSIAVNANTVGTFFSNLLLNNNARQIEAYSSLYRTVVTSAGVENISFSDAKKIYFTGTAAHDIVLPNATAGVVGFEVKIVNNSTGALTIWADFTGGSLVTVLPGKNPGVTRGGWGFFTLIDTAAQVAASWSPELGTTMI